MFFCIRHKSLSSVFVFFVFLIEFCCFLKVFLFCLNSNKPCDSWIYSGLLSEKPDDTLFFLDVGQPKKVEQKGKYVLKLLNYFQFYCNKAAYGFDCIVVLLVYCL